MELCVLLANPNSATIETGAAAVNATSLGEKRKDRITLFLLLAVALFGAGKRISLYLCNRAFWCDEAGLAVNVWHRDYAGLMQQLDFNKASPLLFLWAAKLSVMLLGVNEMAFRLVPLILGLCAIALCGLLARHQLNRWQSVFVVSMFALSWQMTRYSVTFKHYSADVCSMLLMCICFSRYDESKSWRWALALAAAGAISLWFSFASAFFIGAAAIALVAMSVKRLAPVGHVIPIVVSWILSYAGLWLCQMSHLAGHKELMELYPTFAFLPLDCVARWVPDALEAYASECLYLHWTTLVLAAVGAVFAARQKPALTFILLFPILPVVFLSAMHVYPAIERFLLFFVPGTLIFLAVGLGKITTRFGLRWLVLAALLAGPIAAAPFEQFYVWETTGIREAVKYIHDQWQPGDVLNRTDNALEETVYYTHVFDFAGRYSAYDSWNFPRALKLPKGKLILIRQQPRFWLLCSGYLFMPRFERGFTRLRDRLQTDFVQLDHQSWKGAEVFLFDLTRKPDAQSPVAVPALPSTVPTTLPKTSN